MGDVGAVATLLNTIIGWAVNDDGYQSWSRERKVKELHDAMLLAVKAGHYDIADQLFARLKQLSSET